jgi:hypothetical protein
MRDRSGCISLIRIRLEAIADDRYGSQKMARQAARDALKDLETLEKHLMAEEAAKGGTE